MIEHFSNTFVAKLAPTVQRVIFKKFRGSQSTATRPLIGTLALSAVLALGACSTPPPTDYDGEWKPVNRFQDAPAEIPLAPVYTFYASPLDLTLKTMLKRWAADNNLELSYQLNADYTLYKPVAKLRTTDIQAAAQELSAIYARQGVSVTVDGKNILVQPSGGAHAPQAAIPPIATTPAVEKNP